MAEETTALTTYTEPVVEAAPVLTDPKAQRSWVKYKRNQQLLDALAGTIPVATMVGSVVILKQCQYRGLMSAPAANLTATVAVLATAMQAMPPEAWNALGAFGVAVADKLPGGLWDVIF